MPDRDDDDRSRSLSFSLPPISLPPIRLPERFFRVLPPKIRRRTRAVGGLTVLVVAVAFDAVDATLALSTTPAVADWMRVGAGTAVALLFAGPFGLAYAWEAMVLLVGFGWLTAVPTVTLLVLARLFREGFGRRHPEEVDGVAETEG